MRAIPWRTVGMGLGFFAGGVWITRAFSSHSSLSELILVACFCAGALATFLEVSELRARTDRYERWMRQNGIDPRDSHRHAR